MTGFLREIKTSIVQALDDAFTLSRPEPDADGGTQKVYVSVEYPIARADYPAVWVDFEVAELRAVGIAYTEQDMQGNVYSRWRFTGHATFTSVALSSNERDMLYDQLIATMAFASQQETAGAFRQAVENLPLIAATWSFDTIEDRGKAEAPGTPWLTDEMVYERGIALQVIGEFVSDPDTAQLVLLSQIEVVATMDGFPDDSSIIAVTD